MELPVAAALIRCPLCERPLRNLQKAKTINGVRVCSTCRRRFANRRQIAYGIDSSLWTIVVSVPLMLIQFVYYADSILTADFTLSLLGLNNPVAFLGFWIIPFFFLMKDGFDGFSIGKYLTGVQAVDTNTLKPIGFKQSFKRNAVFMIPFGTLAIALTMMKGRRLGDKFANTTVIWKKYAFKSPFDPRGVRCTRCGYNLTGNVSGRCPECGLPVPDEEPKEKICDNCGYDLADNASSRCPKCGIPVPKRFMPVARKATRF